MPKLEPFIVLWVFNFFFKLSESCTSTVEISVVTYSQDTVFTFGPKHFREKPHVIEAVDIQDVRKYMNYQYLSLRGKFFSR